MRYINVLLTYLLTCSRSRILDQVAGRYSNSVAISSKLLDGGSLKPAGGILFTYLPNLLDRQHQHPVKDGGGRERK